MLPVFTQCYNVYIIIHSVGLQSLCRPWVAWWLEHRTPDLKAWVRCPMPPNTLQVHTEYVLVKSVGSKVLWAESRVHGTGEYFPAPPVPRKNCGGRWCRHLLSLRGISPS
ncbi:uncharacterized protein TNCV_4107321 [Trichonephila clavipes]|nr:uncharacterized protein TNCV_4107321 [Trichonephila clavipes]